jgi:hypothetical protein
MKENLSLAILLFLIPIVSSAGQITRQVIATGAPVSTDVTTREVIDPQMASQAISETYTVSVPCVTGHFNILVPPDAVVVSTRLLRTRGTVLSGRFWYVGTFNLRCYKFAQIAMNYDEKSSGSVDVEIQVNRYSVPYALVVTDPLSDKIMERLRVCSSSSTGGWMYFGNLEKAETWKGYPILSVNKNAKYGLPNGLRVNYVIITSQRMQSSLTTFIELKRQQGLETFVMTAEAIGGQYIGDSLQSKTREFLKDAFNTWNMEYVLIVGGAGTLPPLKYQDTHYEGQVEDCTTDYYYMTLEQSADTFSFHISTSPTDFPDFILGRFPSDDESEVRNMIGKTMSYETDTNPGQWVRTNLLVGGEENIGNPTWQWQQYTPKDRPRLALLYPYNLTKQALVNILNQGVGSVCMLTHATPYGWWLGGSEYFDYPAVDLLANTKLPVIFSIGCHSGKFDAPQSVAVKMLSKLKGGAVAIISGSFYTPYGDDVYYSAYNCWGRCPVVEWRVPNSDYNIGKAFFYFLALNPNIVYMNILGDPSLVLATSRYDLVNIPEFHDLMAVSVLPILMTMALLSRRQKRARRVSLLCRQEANVG